jgi:hypothetical protein
LALQSLHSNISDISSSGIFNLLLDPLGAMSATHLCSGFRRFPQLPAIIAAAAMAFILTKRPSSRSRFSQLHDSQLRQSALSKSICAIAVLSPTRRQYRQLANIASPQLSCAVAARDLFVPKAPHALGAILSSVHRRSIAAWLTHIRQHCLRYDRNSRRCTV